MPKLIIFLFVTLSGFADVITSRSLNGIGTTTVTGSAMVSYFGNTTNDPGSTTISAEIEAITLGPIRPGFLEISGGGGGEFGNATVRVGGYGSICGELCSAALIGSSFPIPFTLGVPFEISVSAFATTFQHGSGEISFQFSLFEDFILLPPLAPGLPPQEIPGVGNNVAILAASSVPEPAILLPMGMGLLCLMKIHAARRTKARRSAPLGN